MDPLSVVASVIGILQAVGTIVNYLNHVKSASKDQQSAALELCNLQGLLQRLRFRVQEAHPDDSWYDQIKQLATNQGPLDQFKDKIEAIANKIVPASKVARIKTKLMWISEKSDLQELLTQVERLKSLIDLALSDDHFTLSRAIHSNLQDVKLQMNKLQSSQTNELNGKIAAWLRIPDPSVNYHAALRKRQEASGTWLLTSKEYEQWKHSFPSSMWLNGKPGCGKTILSSTIIEDVQRTSKGQAGTCTAYFYFDFNDGEKQTLTSCLRSLLFQMATQISMTELIKLYGDRNVQDTPPRDDDVTAILYDLLDQARNAYIIMDALDESGQRDTVITMIQDMIQSHGDNLHLLVTSRPEQDIKDGLSQCIGQDLDLSPSSVQDDISAYIQNRLQNDSKLSKWPTTVQLEIRDMLLTRADGMFRWVFCQMEAISTCYKLPKLRQTLSTLPKTLDETYARILGQIEDDGNLEDAIRTLQLLCFSLRPLNQEEIVEVLAVDLTNEKRFDPDNRLRQPDDLMLICPSLISVQVARIDSAAGQSYDEIQVRPAHFSVQEYLLSDRSAYNAHFQLSYAHRLLAESCLIYLAHVCDSNITGLDILTAFPLIQYAAENWWRHLQESGSRDDNELLSQARKFFVNDSHYMNAWLGFCYTHTPWGLRTTDEDLRKLPTSLYIAASIGYCDMVENLLDNGADINAYGGERGTALSIASSQGHDHVVRRLLERGADVDYRGNGNKTIESPLWLACDGDHPRVANILLEHGADVHATNSHDISSLHVAAYSKQISIISALLNHGAETDRKDAYQNTPLHIASRMGHQQIARVLLDRGAEVDIHDGFAGTPLYIASINGRLDTVKLLVQRGANPHVQDSFGNTPLYISSSDGDVKLVRYLLDLGADVQVRNVERETPLWMAAKHGHSEVVQMLIASGSDVNARDRWGRSVLQAARNEGHDYVVELLLQTGADDDPPPSYKDQGSISGPTAMTEQHSSDTIERVSSTPRTSDSQGLPERDGVKADDAQAHEAMIDGPTTGDKTSTPADETTEEAGPENVQPENDAEDLQAAKTLECEGRGIQTQHGSCLLAN